MVKCKALFALASALYASLATAEEIKATSVVEDLQTPLPSEDLQALSVAEDLQAPLPEDLQAVSVVEEDVQALSVHPKSNIISVTFISGRNFDNHHQGHKQLETKERGNPRHLHHLFLGGHPSQYELSFSAPNVHHKNGFDINFLARAVGEDWTVEIRDYTKRNHPVWRPIGKLWGIVHPHWSEANIDFFTTRPSDFIAHHQVKLRLSCKQTHTGIFDFAEVKAKKFLGQVCSDGTPGLEGVHGVCCDLRCGRCGGGGCGRLPLGGSSCCNWGIMRSGQVCGKHGRQAPCMLPNVSTIPGK